AATLNAISKDGAKAFYQGEISADIINAVQTAKGNPGVLAQKDFDAYSIKQREPVCSAYESYDICGMGPPSSGAL
ncbi:gamma-glutamyltransferase, partial [Vibrio cyclitrophicus]